MVHDWDALLPGLKQAIQADFVSAWFMYGVLIVLVAFSVLNTQLMSVLERTKEFGIVMSLGVTPGRLGRLVLAGDDPDGHRRHGPGGPSRGALVVLARMSTASPIRGSRRWAASSTCRGGSTRRSRSSGC